MTPSLQIRKVSVRRGGRRVLSEVSLEVAPGAITALLGANGAGKSTLTLTVGGVLRCEAGEIVIGDTPLDRLRAEKIRGAGVAVVPEGRRLLRSLTVQDNLRAATYSLPRRDAKDGLAYALELFPELEKRWNVAARLLSGGEQQMLVLAQALVSRPQVMIVDEMSLGLAPVIVRRLMPALTTVAAGGTGVLLIEQFAHVALALADSAYVLDHGRIQYNGTAGELRKRPDLLEAAYRLNESGRAA